MFKPRDSAHPDTFTVFKGSKGEFWPKDANDAFTKYGNYIVKPGKECLDSAAPLFKAIVLVEDCNRFVLISSLSHLLGDGHTYYVSAPLLVHIAGSVMFATSSLCLFPPQTIHNMLAPTAPIQSMNRDFIDVSATEEAIIEQFADFGAFVKGMGLNRAQASAYAPAFYCGINRAGLDSIKAELKGGETDYVSSNDIITAAFLEASAPDVGIMACDIRSRLEDVPNEHAGNYGSTIKYIPEDFHPAQIRKSITAGRCQRVSEAPQVPPGTEAFNISIITNWASFAENLMPLDGCELLLHQPIGTTDVLGMLSIAVIYQPKPASCAHLCLFTLPYLLVTSLWQH